MESKVSRSVIITATVLMSTILCLVFFVTKAHAYSTIQANQDPWFGAIQQPNTTRVQVGFTASSTNTLTAIELFMENIATDGQSMIYTLFNAGTDNLAIGNGIGSGAVYFSEMEGSQTQQFSFDLTGVIVQGNKYAIEFLSNRYPDQDESGDAYQIGKSTGVNLSYPTYVSLDGGAWTLTDSVKIKLLTGSPQSTGALSIVQPQDGSEYNASSLQMEGTCSETVNGKLCQHDINGNELPATCSWFDAACFGNQWINYDYTLPTSTDVFLYRITATSTTETSTAFFTHRWGTTVSPEVFDQYATTTIPIAEIQLTFLPSCNIPFLNFDPCRAINNAVNDLLNATAGIIKRNVDKGLNTRPYSYVKDIYDTIVLANGTPSTTLTGLHFVSATSSINVDMMMFNASSTTLILSQQDWDNLRPSMNLLLYLVFAVYIYYRFIKSV